MGFTRDYMLGSLSTFYRRQLVDEFNDFWEYEGVRAYFRLEIWKKVDDGVDIATWNIGDLEIEPPRALRVERLVAQIRSVREPGDRRTHLLVSGMLHEDLVKWFRSTEGWREIRDGYETEYLLDLRSREESARVDDKKGCVGQQTPRTHHPLAEPSVVDGVCRNCGREVPSLYALLRDATGCLEDATWPPMLLLNASAMGANQELRCHLGVCQDHGVLPPRENEPEVFLVDDAGRRMTLARAGTCESCGLADPPTLFEVIRRSEDDLRMASYSRARALAEDHLRDIVRRNRDVLRCLVRCCGATAVPSYYDEPAVAVVVEGRREGSAS